MYVLQCTDEEEDFDNDNDELDDKDDIILCEAASHGETDIVRVVLRANVNVNEKTWQRRRVTPMLCAYSCKPRPKFSPTATAARFAQAAMCGSSVYLLQLKGNVGCCAGKKIPLLQTARGAAPNAAPRDSGCVRVLLEAKGIDCANSRGDTPLSVAAGNASLVALLRRRQRWRGLTTATALEGRPSARGGRASVVGAVRVSACAAGAVATNG